HAAGQDIVREVQDVITLVIGQVDLEQVEGLVDLFHQTHPLRQGVNGSQTSATHGPGSLGHFVVQITTTQHRLDLLAPVSRLKAPLDSGLAITEDSGIASIHSKCSLHGLVWFLTNSFQPMLTGISSFSSLIH